MPAANAKTAPSFSAAAPRPNLRLVQGPAGVPRRAAGAVVTAELVRFASDGAALVNSSATFVHLVAPISGRLVIELGKDRLTVGERELVLLARNKSTPCRGEAGAAALVVKLRRARLQARAGQILETPCRLSPRAVSLRISDHDPLGLAMAELGRAVGAAGRVMGAEVAALEPGLTGALVETIRQQLDAFEVFGLAGSVKRAVDHVQAAPAGPCSPEDLAAAAGVTVATLRRNFKGCLGTTVGGYVQGVRLERIRSRLECTTEWRSIRELAKSGGFASASALTRAYQSRFGETPSQTRSRAFRTPRD